MASIHSATGVRRRSARGLTRHMPPQHHRTRRARLVCTTVYGLRTTLSLVGDVLSFVSRSPTAVAERTRPSESDAPQTVR